MAAPGAASPVSFRRVQRLLDGKDFTRVMRRGKRSQDSNFLVYVLRNRIGLPRLGLSVSRRVSRLATGRNLIKRILREQFRSHAAALPDIDIVVNARQAAGRLNRRELNVAANTIFHQLIKSSN